MYQGGRSFHCLSLCSGLTSAGMHCSEDIEYDQEDDGGADSIVQASRLLVRSSCAYDVGACIAHSPALSPALSASHECNNIVGCHRITARLCSRIEHPAIYSSTYCLHITLHQTADLLSDLACADHSCSESSHRPASSCRHQQEPRATCWTTAAATAV